MVIDKDPTAPHEAVGRLLDVLTSAQVDVLGEPCMRLLFGSVAEFASGGAGVFEDHRIIRLSTLVKMRANLDPIFEYDDQACLCELDALIAGDPR